MSGRPQNRRLLRQYRGRIDVAHSRCSEYHRRTFENERFLGPGHQWPRKIRQALEDRGLPALELNQVFPIVMSIVGKEQVDRFRPRIRGLKHDSTGLGEVFDATLKWGREKCSAERHESRAFRAAGASGLAGLCVRTNLKRRTPEIEMEWVPLSELTWDVNSKEPNLEDRRWHARGQWVDEEDFYEKHPSERGTFRALYQRASDAEWEGASEWTTGPQTWTDGYDHKNKRIFLVRYEWRTQRQMLDVEVPPQVAQLWQAARGEALPDRLGKGEGPMLARLLAVAARGAELGMGAEAQGVEPIYVSLEPKEFEQFQVEHVSLTGFEYQLWFEVETEEFHYADIAAGKVIAQGRLREGCWSIYFITGFSVEEEGEGLRYFGLVDLLRDRQLFENKMFSAMLHHMSVLPKSGAFVDMSKTDAELEDLEDQFAAGGALIAMRDPKESVAPFPRGSMPAGTSEMFQFARDSMPGAVGTSPYAIGAAQNLSRTSNSAIQTVTAAQNTVLSQLFDSLRQARKAVAGAMLRGYVTYFSVRDLVKVVGPELAAYVPQDRRQWLAVLEYRVEIGEEPSTEASADAALQRFVQTGLLQYLMQTGNAPPVEVLISLFAPSIGATLADKWLESVQGQQQQGQQATEQLQQVMGLIQQLVERVNALEGSAQ